MNTTIAALLSLITSPERDFGRAPCAVAVSVAQPHAWAALRGVVRRVPVPGKRRPVVPTSVYLHAAAASHDAFDRALRAMVPTLRAAGIRAPYQAALPVGCLVGVAEVAGVVREGDGLALDLAAVQPLPFAVDIDAPRAAIFTVRPGEFSYVEGWGFVLESSERTIEGAAALLTRAGFDPDAARDLAAVSVPAIVRAEAEEAALNLHRRAEALVAKHKPAHAPRKTSQRPIASVA